MTKQDISQSIWITGDQCSTKNSALAAADKSIATVLMIESIARGNKLKYHKKKLVLIYSVMRHFAEELRREGWNVDYYTEAPNFQAAIDEHLTKNPSSSVLLMEQTEYGATDALVKMLGDRQVTVLPHCNFISSAKDYAGLQRAPGSRVTMESFYRHMRKKTGLLMDGNSPYGDIWNFDKSNRQAPDDSFSASPIREFPPDKITRDVIAMVERYFPDHPGTCDGWIYAVTRKDALLAAQDFFDNRLDEFGPHQDAMLLGKPFLNHSILSPYINTCLLHPLELCREAEQRFLEKRASLASVEGFVRQLIGWREFIWRVYWLLMPSYKKRNKLQAREKLPEFYWTGDTSMRCMKDAIDTTRDHGYAHHIIRLMILGNFALIAGLDPLETNDWFASMFVDGYDWVMVPNVIGMTLHADGGHVGTKPYAASANYINKMSNYCGSCHYEAKKTFGEKACPFNALYWDFMLRNEKVFAGNHRMAMTMKALSSKSPDWKNEIRKRANDLRQSGWR